MIFFDISPDILSAKLYGEDTPPRLESVCDMSAGDVYNLSDITMCLHTGAHIDAPLHFVEDGEPVDRLPLEKFIGKCTVASANGPITAQWIEKNMPWNCKKLLIKCGGNGYLMDNAVFELCRFDLDLVGIDALSIAPEDNEASVHRELMYNDIAILEGIDLSKVDDGDYFLFAAPIKIGDAEAAPCRALLIKGLLASV
ncbi:MAG: cyclase family protein [Eubacterium sp.]|nr:cyclase family protein [Eubacterium sp.]